MQVDEKALMNVEETRSYLGIGDTMVRKLLQEEDFGLRIGNRLYCNKVLLDKWIIEQGKKDKTIIMKKRRKRR